MIKEHIEKLPGGKEFIRAEQIKGMTIGILIGIALYVLFSLIIMRDIQTIIDAEIFVLLLFIVGILTIISIVFTIIYYRSINNADNIYMKNISSENCKLKNKEGENR